MTFTTVSSALWPVSLLPSGPGGPLAGPEGTSEFSELKALSTGKTLGGQLKLKWMLVSVSWGLQHRSHFGAVARAGAGHGPQILVAPVGLLELRRGAGLEWECPSSLHTEGKTTEVLVRENRGVPGYSAEGVPWQGGSRRCRVWARGPGKAYAAGTWWGVRNKADGSPEVPKCSEPGVP